MKTPRYPSLYQINTRVWLTELSRTLGRAATLDDEPVAEEKFDWSFNDADLPVDTWKIMM